MQDGPVVVGAALNGTRDKGYDARLYGTIKTGTDGAIIHFEKMKLYQEGETPETGPTGPERDICAIGYGAGDPIPLGESPRSGPLPLRTTSLTPDSYS